MVKLKFLDRKGGKRSAELPDISSAADHAQFMRKLENASGFSAEDENGGPACDHQTWRDQLFAARQRF